MSKPQWLIDNEEDAEFEKACQREVEEECAYNYDCEPPTWANNYDEEEDYSSDDDDE